MASAGQKKLDIVVSQCTTAPKFTCHNLAIGLPQLATNAQTAEAQFERLSRGTMLLSQTKHKNRCSHTTGLRLRGSSPFQQEHQQVYFRRRRECSYVQIFQNSFLWCQMFGSESGRHVSDPLIA
jgi:hypothetical protein